ncbi:hypothetical protein EVAR_44285_1 [Eumeta japonica]|uniref:Uncharacterized protein n=1 Tax=Eumeta variegata TaxID=151549 RepID=A0A4C1WT50_EUMVA|nr:hypothetical protein EVAR_44285_1 [Eumeta japonica]
MPNSMTYSFGDLVMSSQPQSPQITQLKCQNISHGILAFEVTEEFYFLDGLSDIHHVSTRTYRRAILARIEKKTSKPSSRNRILDSDRISGRVPGEAAAAAVQTFLTARLVPASGRSSLNYLVNSLFIISSVVTGISTAPPAPPAACGIHRYDSTGPVCASLSGLLLL